MVLDNTRQSAVLLSLNSKPSQEKASCGLLGSNPLKVRSARLAKLMVWIPPNQNSRGCEWVKFFPGRKQGEDYKAQGAYGTQALDLRGLGAWDGSITWEPVPLPRASDAHCPHQGRQLLLESTCRQASTPEHFSNRYSVPPPFLLTDRPTGQTPWAPARCPPSSPHTHSTQAPPSSSGRALDS